MAVKLILKKLQTIEARLRLRLLERRIGGRFNRKLSLKIDAIHERIEGLQK